MGFFSRFGSKISHAAHHLGQKAQGVAKKVGKAADVVGKVAKGVSAVAGTLAAIGAAADTAASVADHGGHAIDSIRKGNIMGAVKEVKATEKAGRSLKKQIERKK